MRAEREWVLHEAGYTHTPEATIDSLTRAERRRLHEGKRVHEQIKQLIRDMTDETGGIDVEAAKGRTVPRPSDERKLQEWADRLDGSGNGGLGSASGTGVR